MSTTPMSGTKIRMKIENPSIAGTYIERCMINTDRAVRFESQVATDVVNDCDNPDNPGTVYVFKEGISFSFTGQGKFDSASLDFFMDWFESDTAYNAKLYFDNTGAQGGQYITCTVKLTAFEVSGKPKTYAEANMTIMSHGAWTRTNTA